MNNDIAVISTFFNPLKYKNRYENYLKFQNFIYDCGLKDHFYVSELLYNNEEPFINHENVIRFKMEDIFWHKERALNLTAKILPKQYSKVIWVDADMIWFNKNWWKEVSKLLDEYNVVQPYSSCQYLRSNFSTERKTNSVLFYICQNNFNEKGLVGGAMAYKREFFDTIGLYDRAIMGGGDIVSIMPILKTTIPTKYAYFDLKLNEYLEKATQYINNRYYYLDELICHLYHGRIFDRGYKDRYKMNENLTFDDLCEVGESGLYKFKSNVTKIVKFNYIKYFEDRNEDWEQLIYPLNKRYMIEKNIDGSLYKWYAPTSVFELKNIKSIKLQIDRRGNPYTSPYLNVIVNEKFKQFALNLENITEIIIPDTITDIGAGA
ncbi:MAG TPA: hypothetical protein PKX15_02340, partial [Bacteroidales bacterium]|nr:hypothetical protein [Bacteroidales bacterium]